MTKLIVPKKRGLTRSRKSGFPFWSDWMDDFFASDFPTLATSPFNLGMTMPKVNIKETEDAFEVEMAVPGMTKADFDINVENDVLTISTETKEEKEETNETYTRREFGYSAFKRSFSLPEGVDEGKIKATYNEGILNINLPKMEEAKQKPARSIEIS